MKKGLALGFFAVMTVLAVTGCGSKADTDKPMNEVTAEAQQMSAAELEKTARAYSKEMAATRGEIEKSAEKLKTLSPQEMLGEKGKEFREKSAELGKKLNELTQRYKVYADQYLAKGGDLSKVEVK